MGTVRSLRGATFGGLHVPTAADPEIRHGRAYWPCDCECGRRGVWARGTALTQGRIVSCGCRRADPGIRRAARMQVPADLRHTIASMGGVAARGAARAPRKRKKALPRGAMIGMTPEERTAHARKMVAARTPGIPLGPMVGMTPEQRSAHGRKMIAARNRRRRGKNPSNRN